MQHKCEFCEPLTLAPPPSRAADGHHAFATCMVSYGFMGDVMAESENYRWLGPLRYDVVRRRRWQGPPDCSLRPPSARVPPAC